MSDDPVPDYTKMEVPTMLNSLGDDAAKWAAAFCQHAKMNGLDLDEGWMTGWFANAIEVSHDKRSRARGEEPQLRKVGERLMEEAGFRMEHIDIERPDDEKA